MKKLLKNLFVLNALFIVSSFSLNLSSESDNSIIPIEKLVCYGQGTGFSLSPSGEYVAAMVPVDENKCDIEDLSDKELIKSRRVLVVTNLATMEANVLSGTTASTSIQGFNWLNDNQLLLTRDGRAELDSYSYYTIDRDGKNTELLIEIRDELKKRN